ncbi:MAG: hypothetical protein GXY77_03170 [Fibrobacter sp.]|nr:hypothetical protein [Fibrobacter sp.]
MQIQFSKSTLDNISNLENRLRDLINSHRLKFILLKNHENWNSLCSSLDLIEDTQIAIESYSYFKDLSDAGATYLVIYGILQTLLLQQNSVKNIAEAIGLNYKLPKELNKIRIIRNSAAGHPEKEVEKGIKKSSFIIRASVSPLGFEMLTSYSNLNEEYHSVSIIDLIKIQNDFINQVLVDIVNELERQVMAHRKKHAGLKLVDIFPTTLNYHIGKISEAVHRNDRFDLGIVNIQTINNAIEDLKIELTNRGIWGAYDSIDYHYEYIEYALNRILGYFNSDSNLNQKDAYVFSKFLNEQLISLKDIVKEIDDEYASETV